uniref:Aldo/keto reductase. Aldoketo-oxidoreductase, NADP-binding n=1 Tax=Magnetococcus massalia (strain MO-1) TaxID=451514 RepID=A0A1S7LGT2_MAGMO|nr:Aldo/keto reductase. Aldoketo-oxidoreductase, NADP-binding [Candidatus Magnetococcus massalia]
MKRRQFLQGSMAAATVAASGGVMLPAESHAQEKASIQQYRKLGNTDLKMSDIAFGAARLRASSLVLRALDRGVNYIDTAPDYGHSEEAVGEALTRYKQRDKMIIASKFCLRDGTPTHPTVGSGVATYIGAVEASLKRMGTDYLDVVFTHALGGDRSLEREQQRLLDPDMLEAFDRLKQQGKVRYLATSSHGPYNMEELMLQAVRSGHYDIIMPAFNFMRFPKLPELLSESKARGVGVIAMKTLAGAKASGDALLDGGSFEQAAFKWVLKHPEVAGLVISIKRVSDLDRFLPASGQSFAQQDQKVLNRYAALFGNEYCRTGCSDCESSCSAGVPVGEILRQRMYFEDYGEEKRAMSLYAALPTKADICSSCSDDGCAGACQHGIPVGQALRGAHELLFFS